MFFLCCARFSLQKNVFRMLGRGFMQGCFVLREFCILKKYFLSVGTSWLGLFCALTPLTFLGRAQLRHNRLARRRSTFGKLRGAQQCVDQGAHTKAPHRDRHERGGHPFVRRRPALPLLQHRSPPVAAKIDSGSTSFGG